MAAGRGCADVARAQGSLAVWWMHLGRWERGPPAYRACGERVNLPLGSQQEIQSHSVRVLALATQPSFSTAWVGGEGESLGCLLCWRQTLGALGTNTHCPPCLPLIEGHLRRPSGVSAPLALTPHFSLSGVLLAPFFLFLSLPSVFLARGLSPPGQSHGSIHCGAQDTEPGTKQALRKSVLKECVDSLINEGLR